MSTNIPANGLKRSSNLNWGIVLLRKTSNVIEILTDALTIIGYVIITVTILAASLSRYVFQSPLAWTVEMSRFVFVWVVLLGVSAAEREDAHFQIKTFVELFPRSVKVVVKLFADLVVIASLIILFFISLPYVHQGSRGIAPALQLPLNYVFISLPIGVVLTLLVRLQKVWYHIHEITNPCISQIEHIPDLEQIAHRVKSEGKIR